MNPDAATIAAGAPIEVESGTDRPRQDIKVFCAAPIYIMNRTKKQIEARAVPVKSPR